MTAVSMKAQRKMQKATVGHVIGSVLKYAFLLLLAVIALVPFVWMISSSLKTSVDVFSIPMQWIPKEFHWENYLQIWERVPLLAYFKNTAVLAATGNYNPMTLRIAAVIAIALSFFGKAIGVVETVPNCVLGGACIVLYGMIASVGLRTLVENHVDFTKNRNLCIAAIMLVLAMGGAVIGGENFSFSGIGLGIIAGILLNLIMPEGKTVNNPGLVAHSVPENEIVEEK